ncbi:hypothetical protein ACFZAV_39185 [Streptomyces sp. NPDC008343]|uniref:hypothetical protein n=1 Tax=Streptomyces sp. NPDC008343 TaxID=3364828 RepID=UPI0036EDF5FA
MVMVSADAYNNSVLQQPVADWVTALVYGSGVAFMAAILFFWWKPLPRPRHHPPHCRGVTAAG